MPIASGGAGGRAVRAYAIKKGQIASGLLVACFFGSFVPYVVGVSTVTLASAAGLFLASTFVGFPLIYARELGPMIRALRSPRLALFALLMPLGPCIVAASSGAWNPIAYALLMSAVLVSCQLVLGVMSMREVIRAFSLAGAPAVLLFIATDWQGMVHATLTASRLIPAGAQPNALGFIFAGFVLAFSWRAADRSGRAGTRILFACFALLTLFMIFILQSRASLLAVSCGYAWIAMIASIRTLRRSRLRVRVVSAAAVFLILCGIGIGAMTHTVRDKATAYVLTGLKLESRYRGLGSGLSGRLPRWSATVAAINRQGFWTFGAGYRTATGNLGFSVDNGYLTIIYEQGLVGLLAILAQIAWVLVMLARQSLHAWDSRDRTFVLAASAIIVSLLVNNIFDRYLFGIGNPFSLLALFFLISRRSQLGYGRHAQVKRTFGRPGVAFATPAARP